jgi:16S rRNA (cytosine967-C5)-methyltransferase
MNHAARLKTVIDILKRIEESRVPMDSTIGDFMRTRRFIGAKDRANIVERVYAIIRAQARLDWWMQRLQAPPYPRYRALLWLALGEQHKDPESLFDGSQYGAEVLSDVGKTILIAATGQPLDHPDMPEAVRVECPTVHEAALRQQFGADFAKEMEAMLHGASLDLRVNTKHITRENAQGSLAKDGVITDLTVYSPWGLRARSKAFLSHTKAFVKGWVEIQDEGSQLIAYVCGAKPGMQVLDFCAGGGGKTLALAAAMQIKGRIVATDTEASRLEKARLRFRRAGASDIVEVRPLSDEKNRKWLRRQKETFDVTLCDVPCSGSGTWRRNPDMRWRVFGPKPEELIPVQADILDRACKTVKKGGRLVYATCSLLPSENEEQVAAFLARNPDFRVKPLPEIWEAETPCPCDGDFMRLTPLRHGTDGFFAAVMERV